MVEKNVDVIPSDLTIKEIKSLPDQYHLPLVLYFNKLYNEYKTITEEQSKVIQDHLKNQQHTQDYDLQNVSIHTERPVEYRKTAVVNPSGVMLGSVVGNKVGKTSKYHYTYWNNKRGKWMNNFTNEIFDDEILCAISADNWLRTNDTKNRPLNVDEFPEIMKHGGSK